MNFIFRITSLTNILILSMYILYGQPQAHTIGIFDNHLDIGAVKHKGFVSYDPVAQQYLIGGSGKNMWFGEDEMHYLWKSVQGDFILRAEVAFIGDGVDPHRKVGWTVRNNFETSSPMVTMQLDNSQLTQLNSGFADRNNNDHVLSFDGEMLAISHHNQADEGRSSIYIMPASGSTQPKKVPKDGVGHSYLHGYTSS